MRPAKNNGATDAASIVGPKGSAVGRRLRGDKTDSRRVVDAFKREFAERAVAVHFHPDVVGQVRRRMAEQGDVRPFIKDLISNALAFAERAVATANEDQRREISTCLVVIEETVPGALRSAANTCSQFEGYAKVAEYLLSLAIRPIPLFDADRTRAEQNVAAIIEEHDRGHFTKHLVELRTERLREWVQLYWGTTELTFTRRDPVPGWPGTLSDENDASMVKLRFEAAQLAVTLPSPGQWASFFEANLGPVLNRLSRYVRRCESCGGIFGREDSRERFCSSPCAERMRKRRSDQGDTVKRVIKGRLNAKHGDALNQSLEHRSAIAQVQDLIDDHDSLQDLSQQADLIENRGERSLAADVRLLVEEHRRKNSR